MNIQSSARGLINIQVRKPNGEVFETGYFKNLLLDTFFARFAANNTAIGTMRCVVGTGTTAPANGDTALVYQVASISQTSSFDVNGTLDSPNNRIVFKAVRQFEAAIGAVVANLGEVGFEFAVSSGGLHAGLINSRSLTKDSFGTPTTITVTADDQLIVNYTLEISIPLVDYTGTVNIAGVDYAAVGRVADQYTTTTPNNSLALPTALANQFKSYQATSVFGAHGVAPTLESGTGGALTSTFLSVSGGKEYEMSGTINQLNATGGIGVLTIPIGAASNGRGFKYQFTPAIPKDATKPFKMRFRMTCVRA